MPSQLITPPDRIISPHSYLIVNAIDTSVDTLVLWLRTVPEEYDIHLYHSEMITYHDWAVQVAEVVPRILVEKTHVKYLVDRLQQILEKRSSAVTEFGPGSSYPELVQYFLKNRLE